MYFGQNHTPDMTYTDQNTGRGARLDRVYIPSTEHITNIHSNFKLKPIPNSIKVKLINGQSGIVKSYTEEARNKASAYKENPPITTRIFSPQMPFLLILYIGNKASLAIRHEINWSLEMRYCRVPLYHV